MGHKAAVKRILTQNFLFNKQFHRVHIENTFGSGLLPGDKAVWTESIQTFM
jgi:hypothetical protein